MRRPLAALVPLPALALAACGTPPEATVAPAPPMASASASAPPSASVATAPPAAPPQKLDTLKRADFNRLAGALFLPLYWTADTNKNDTLDPPELAVLWGFRGGPYAAEDAAWVDRDKGQFSSTFLFSYAKMVEAQGAKIDGPDAARRNLVLSELGQGRPTLVETDLRAFTPGEKRFVEIILEVAELTERIFQKQKGTWDMRLRVPKGSPESQTLFFRNQGPRCEAPLTQNEAACSAIPDAPKGRISGLYPLDMLSDAKFCDALSGHADKKTLTDPFTVVRRSPEGKPIGVPYTTAYADEMKPIAGLLAKAAEVIAPDPKEKALEKYLLAASKAFTDNDWAPADEAWTKMGVDNSRWYLRVGPDETYEEPCNTKALFHVSFALINQKSLKWQKKLDPLKIEMEKELAGLAGPPYTARNVSFKLPDFIDIVVNAGDSRSPFGGTIGQSLPNFGAVANEGRGRTVAMTNFYTDPDSMAALRETTESLFCKVTMATYTTDPEPQLMSTVLHEAAHNLGPAHQYKVAGKIDREVFGGPLASTFEELKAQTAALYLTDWLAGRKEITKEDADRAHVRDVVWSFGHISRGMYTETHAPKSYSHLAAIQLGHLMKEGVVTWNGGETAANGKDQGCFTVDLAKFAGAARSLMKEVAGIKGRGDKKAAEALVKRYVDCEADGKPHEACQKAQKVITERVLRQPKPSFFYSIRFK